MAEKLTQKERILNYLQTHKKGITPIDALEKFGCFRLSGRIFELREDGHDIVMNFEEKVNAQGEKKRYARYSLRVAK